MNNFMPTDQVFWYLDCYEQSPKLEGAHSADVAIIGGGMAGLSAAQAFVERGLTVILIEKNFCGAGASGKSSGFITPDSEYSLSDFVRIYGKSDAHKLWELVSSGVDAIAANINNNNLDCDFIIQDTLIVATSKKDFDEEILNEHKVRKELGYESTIYDASILPKYIGSNKYSGAIRYTNSFGINAYKYCQAMKKVLQNIGVKIFEDTTALEVSSNNIKTQHGNIKAKHVIVCTDAYTPQIGKLSNDIYHAQTFLMLSEVLNEKIIQAIFPEKSLMVWDTNLIYNYYRLTPDFRLMLGGASLLYTYAKHEIHNSKYMANLLSNYFKEKFGDLDFSFEYIWPGIIGISKDIMPISGFDKNNIYYIVGAAGLPWAAALGKHSAQVILDKDNSFEKFFSPQRKYPISGFLQAILGKKLTFAISNFIKIGSI